MDSARLQGYLDEGLSLAQIGSLEGKHPSTIGYRLQTLGLEATGRSKYSPRGGLEREQLEAPVNKGWTLRQIADELGVSISTVRYWIKRHGLDAPARARRAKIDDAIAAGRRTIQRTCSRHGRTLFVIETSGRTRCRVCRMEAVSDWRRRTKAKLVAEAGGACVLCGYDRCQAALQFHHLDPSTKAFHLAHGGQTRSLEAQRREMAKCALLCGN